MAHVVRPNASKAEPMLNTFQQSFRATCVRQGLPDSLDAISQFDIEDLRGLVSDLLSALRGIPDMLKLPSAVGREDLWSDLQSLSAVIRFDDSNIERFIPLLEAVLTHEAHKPDDLIWDTIYATVLESRPPRKPVLSQDQTQYLHTTSSIVNSSEERKDMDALLKAELGSICIDVPNFYETFFGSVTGLKTGCATILQRCKEGDSPLYCDETGWRDWPAKAPEKEVLKWISGKVRLFRSFVTEQTASQYRTVLTQPSQPLKGSTASRKLDIAIVSNSGTVPGQIPHWSQILVPGELKSNPTADKSSNTLYDLSRYVREVFTAQHTRRFVQGFTLCGSIMRLWEFDRAGATASQPFDINKDGQRLISVLIGYLIMNDEQMGYDPTIMCGSDGTHSIEIIRHGQPERLILDELVKRSPRVVGRATTCWKAHHADGEIKLPFVIKDSWQYPERDEEGALLLKALEGGVTNVARYYSHQTVYAGGKIDDVLGNIREGLDLANGKYQSSTPPRSPMVEDEGSSSKGSFIGSMVGQKRSSPYTGTEILPPPSKRTCSSSPSKGARNSGAQNRIHRRVIVYDYGKPLYKASSLVAMLAAFDLCMVGYHSLYIETGLIQGDISTGNLMMNEDVDNPSWAGFLIDLDLAVQERRGRPSGAWGKIGTRAFMAIGQLLGEKLSWIHGLESFFWVLLWICIHYQGPNQRSLVASQFDQWNYMIMEDLALFKQGFISDDRIFEGQMENFTEYHKPLKPWVDELRKAVFPNGKARRNGDRTLFSQMRKIVKRAQDALQETAS